MKIDCVSAIYVCNGIDQPKELSKFQNHRIIVKNKKAISKAIYVMLAYIGVDDQNMCTPTERKMI